MVFGEWWGLSKALAKDRERWIKDVAIAVRTAGFDKQAWGKFMRG